MPITRPLPPRLREAAVPPHARRVLARLRADGHPAYLVGGCVRDLLRGAVPNDYDVATRAHPEVVLGLFPRTVATGLQHGTVTVVEPEGLVEVTTFRGEGDYTDGRRPDAVTFLDDVQGDLARRDFTINAMAFDPAAGALVDPFGGMDDLSRRTVRCVGRAADRFAEDGLRPLRAVRFASVLRFELDPATRDAIGPARETYARVAVERVADELRKLLTGPRPARGLALLVDTGLSERVLPALAREAPDLRRHRFRRVSFTPRAHVQRLAALFWGQANALAGLRPSGAVLRTVEAIERLHEPLDPHASDAALRRFASRAGPNLHHALVLQRAELMARGPREAVDAHRRTRSRLRALLSTHPPLQIAQLAIGGDEVTRALGAAGPRVGQALRGLLDAVLDDPNLNTREALLRLLAEPGS